MTDLIEFKIREPIKCSNGLQLSVQASKNHYCIPKNDEGPYSHVEVYSYNLLIPNWNNPIHGYNSITGIPEHVTYYNVPVQRLLDLLYTSGGIVSGNLPKIVL
jgi:hypothetical protein